MGWVGQHKQFCRQKCRQSCELAPSRVIGRSWGEKVRLVVTLPFSQYFQDQLQAFTVGGLFASHSYDLLDQVQGIRIMAVLAIF